MDDATPQPLWPDALSCHHQSLAEIGENLAEEVRLLNLVDNDPSAACLRIWEQPTPAVIVGRSNLVEHEVHVAACDAEQIPILQRTSGGGTVVLGPGCLCFSLCLPLTEHHRHLGVSPVTADIMQRLADALSRPGQPVNVKGVSDLVLDGRKFSGNAQRWRRRALLHHGTVLYDFDLSLINRLLRFPSRIPAYRQSRQHLEFVRNLDLSRAEIIQRLCRAWNAC